MTILSGDPIRIPDSAYPAMVSGSAMGGGVQDRLTLREVKESTSGRPGADIDPAADREYSYISQVLLGAIVSPVQFAYVRMSQHLHVQTARTVTVTHLWWRWPA